LDECELKWQLVLQPSLIWKFHGYLMKFLSKGQRCSSKLEELFAPKCDLFQFLLAPEKLSWNHSHSVIDKIFSYFYSAFKLSNQIRGINYWFAKVAILFKIFIKISLRDLATIKISDWFPKPIFKRLEKGEWLDFKIPSYDIFQDINPLLATYDLL
jgi:hypothetical protein